MSDLLERLRGETDLGECGRLCDEAADEMERLTEANERLQAVVDEARNLLLSTSRPLWHGHCEISSGQVEALRDVFRILDGES